MSLALTSLYPFLPSPLLHSNLPYPSSLLLVPSFPLLLSPRLLPFSPFVSSVSFSSTELGLAEHFDFVMTSEESKAEKPNKEIFEMAMNNAKCVDPTTAYHVGTSIDFDVSTYLSHPFTTYTFCMPPHIILDSSQQFDLSIQLHSMTGIFGRNVLQLRLMLHLLRLLFCLI